MKLSIIIVNRDVKELLLNCLSSIYNNLPLRGEGFNLSSARLSSPKSTDGRGEPPFEFEIFVVDNDSTDGSVKTVKEKFPQVKVIANIKNLGFPKANNQAIKISAGEYVLLLNPDTIILSDAIEKTVDFIENNPQCGMVGPKLINKDGGIQRSCFTTLSLKSIFFESLYLSKVFSSSNYFGAHHYGNWNYNSIRKVDSVSGACMLIRRALIDKIGFLDEDLFCGEDNDLCYRAIKGGFNVVFFPFAKVVHIGHESLKKNVYVKLTNEYLSKIRFFRKYYTCTKTIMLKLLFLVEVWTKIVIRTIGVFINRPKDSQIRLKAYFKVIKELPKV